ncbi:MAG: phenylalanine--tRNA ligase subunit beta [Candidatus Wildermuthbacteria bacterium]|nr:phenylalanine--tRNA ligase subunit beta [Candidatus Wildermuthbacteria bacterium]
MLFSYALLKTFVSDLPSPEKVRDLLVMRAFEVESIEKRGKDTVLDVKILPQRGDCAGHKGLARELSVILEKPAAKEKQRIFAATRGGLIPLRVQLSSKSVLRYSALVVRGSAMRESPAWMQAYLQTLGTRAINGIVDLTNYIMAELGQPLHAFDYDKIRDSSMLVRESKQGEEVLLLDDTTARLPEGTLVIEDGKKASVRRLVDLAGIKGGKLSAIDARTKNIIFQAAVFKAEVIYKTKKSLNYTTQAADIYARGIDPEGTIPALERVQELLKECGGGTVTQRIDIYPKKETPRKIRVPSDMPERYLGARIPLQKSKAILSRFGCKVAGTKLLTVQIPTWRKDISLPQDIVEEIGRIHGYENIQARMPVLPLQCPESNEELEKAEDMRDALREAGFSETIGYSFIGKKDAADFGYSQGKKDALVELQNPYSEEYFYLRPGLTENILKVAAANARNTKRDIRIFELGKTFAKEITVKVVESRSLSGLVAGANAFFLAKGAIQHLFARLRIAEKIWYDVSGEENHMFTEKGGTARIKAGSRNIGIIGRVLPSLIDSYKFQTPVAIFSIDAQALAALETRGISCKQIPRFPAVYRDIAVLVPLETAVADIEKEIQNSAGPLLSELEIFDIYRGKGIPEGKKNIAFHLAYQSPDRTLSANEAESLQRKIAQSLEKHSDWSIRI